MRSRRSHKVLQKHLLGHPSSATYEFKELITRHLLLINYINDVVSEQLRAADCYNLDINTRHLHSVNRSLFSKKLGRERERERERENYSFRSMTPSCRDTYEPEFVSSPGRDTPPHK